MTMRNHRSRSFAPSLNPLEGRVLLSTTATKMVMVSTPIYSHGHDLTTVGLKAEVESLAGTPETTATGTVTFEMVMPAKTKGMKGMKGMMMSGTTIFGTEPLSGGSATLTLPAKKVLKMPLEIIYSGDSNFASSTNSPAMLTKSGLMATAMSSGMKMSSGMGGMRM
jgi:hypothetical protein